MYAQLALTSHVSCCGVLFGNLLWNHFYFSFFYYLTIAVNINIGLRLYNINNILEGGQFCLGTSY